MVEKGKAKATVTAMVAASQATLREIAQTQVNGKETTAKAKSLTGKEQMR